MSNAPTVLVLGRRRTDNMPSLTRMLEILKPREGDTVPEFIDVTGIDRRGMDATATSSVRITGWSTVEPTMGDECWICRAPISGGTVCDSCNKGSGVAPASAWPTMGPHDDCCDCGCEGCDDPGDD